MTTHKAGTRKELPWVRIDQQYRFGHPKVATNRMFGGAATTSIQPGKPSAQRTPQGSITQSTRPGVRSTETRWVVVSNA